MNNLIPIKQSELEEVRTKQWKNQNCECAILKQPISEKEAVMDHKHKLVCEECGGPEGLGCLRGVLHNSVNQFIGKIEKWWKRFGLHNKIDLCELLRNSADYIENPPMEAKYIHPTEVKDERIKLKLSEYKRICKFYFLMFPGRKVLPNFPKLPMNKDKYAWWGAMLKGVNELNKRKKFNVRESLLILRGQSQYKDKMK